ncbi:MAG TPA: tRNA uridine-5-carboxymethylaminomethyl(34) synthesis GTPase MnmE [Rectinemataceae bacterium]|nr:tRNA uridine-5-carboxymethylaminomethyl(34) synthesis GTPase MnmE [Rectinemataceae bacterium]
MQRSYLDEPVPIVAAATPPGESALAVIRAAGPGCLALAARCFSRPRALLEAPGHSSVYGRLVEPSSGAIVDEVLVSVFRAPRSPTGEDGVEFSCHGSPAVVRKALGLLEAAGFAPALPGEFSFRAFLHGKTDLVRAEAVAELIRSAADAARAEAIRRLEGGLSARIGRARAELLAVLAEVQVRLDFDEDQGAPEAELDESALARVAESLAALSDSYAFGRLYAEGARVVVAGRPNAGKSSLFNLMLREERSIVSHEPGTTRDWIEAGLEVEGLPVRLIDTAGLREAGAAAEAEGVSRSRRLLAQADAVIYLVDGVTGLAPEDEAFLSSYAGKGLVPAWNKVDHPSCRAAPEGFVALSARSGAGLQALASALARAILSAAGAADAGLREDEVRVASLRQKGLLDRALQSIREAQAGLSAGAPLDALSLDIGAAADALGEITGEISSAEILEAIFSGFCLGK